MQIDTWGASDTTSATYGCVLLVGSSNPPRHTSAVALIVTRVDASPRLWQVAAMPATDGSIRPTRQRRNGIGSVSTPYVSGAWSPSCRRDPRRGVSLPIPHGGIRPVVA